MTYEANFYLMFINFLKDLLFPLDCQGCNQPGSWLCSSCFRGLNFNGPQINIPLLDRVYVASNYNDPLLAQLIKAYKYNFISELAPELGRFLSTYFLGQVALFPELTNLALIPIPLSKERQRWRGFNQATLLAKEVTSRTGSPLVENLVKIRRSQVQASLGAKKRQDNVAGSLVWQGEDLQGIDVMLVDDVTTTGATLSEGARALKAARARRVYALVLAKG